MFRSAADAATGAIRPRAAGARRSFWNSFMVLTPIEGLPQRELDATYRPVHGNNSATNTGRCAVEHMSTKKLGPKPQLL
jgi:hypothetical protein